SPKLFGVSTRTAETERAGVAPAGSGAGSSVCVGADRSAAGGAGTSTRGMPNSSVTFEDTLVEAVATWSGTTGATGACGRATGIDAGCGRYVTAGSGSRANAGSG